MTNESHLDSDDSFEQRSRTMKEKVAPKKELQAFTTQAQPAAASSNVNVRRRDRQPANTQAASNSQKKKTEVKPPTPVMNSFSKATTSSQNRSESPAFAPVSFTKRAKTAAANEIQNQSITMKNQAKLADLCPEDKSKIGELVKKLASESKAREESQTRLDKEKDAFEQRLQKLQAQAESYQQERDRM